MALLSHDINYNSAKGKVMICLCINYYFLFLLNDKKNPEYNEEVIGDGDMAGRCRSIYNQENTPSSL